MNDIRIPDFTVQKVFGALSETKDWGLIKNGIPDTWKVSQGEGITVFVLDTAGFTNHIDLKDNFITGKNCSRSITPDDKSGHGTHVVGVIAASSNGVGVIGVAPKAKFVLVKVLDDNGSATEFTVSDGLKFCYECKVSPLCNFKPDIISMSLGSSRDMPLVHDWIKKLYALNIPIVCAAGNSGQEGVSYPAKYPEAIAVAAYDKDGNIANFSTFGDEVDFAAPGVDIYSTYLDGEYALLSGTSMAAPWITGLIALLLSKHRKQESLTGKNDCKTVEQIRQHLERYALDQGEVGKDKKWGYGKIDVANLIVAESITTILKTPRKSTSWLNWLVFWR